MSEKEKQKIILDALITFANTWKPKRGTYSNNKDRDALTTLMRKIAQNMDDLEEVNGLYDE